jgi:hypothetical protein
MQSTARNSSGSMGRNEASDSAARLKRLRRQFGASPRSTPQVLKRGFQFKLNGTNKFVPFPNRWLL